MKYLLLLKQRWKYLLLYAITSFVFLLIFSSYTTPLSKINYSDSAFFQMVGAGMTRGLLPYRDFFDMKGPYLFFIEYFAQILCPGRIGIFFIQWVSLFASICVLSRISRLTNHPKLEWILVLGQLLVLGGTFEGGNLTEEYCLFPLLLCTYFALRYMLGENPEHPLSYAFVYGLAFGFITFIRITNAAIICAIVFCALIRILHAGRVKNLLGNMAAFCIGFAAAVFPALVYCARHGILRDMFNAVFGFGFAYAADGGLIEFVLFQPKLILLNIPLLVSTAACLIKKTAFRNKGLAALSAFALLLILSMGNAYNHYYTLLLPHIALCTCILMHGEIDGKAMSRRAVAGIACLVAMLPYVVENGGRTILCSFTDFRSDPDAADIAAHIPESDRDSVYAYGTDPKWYLDTQLYPCIRYCAWQTKYIRLSPQIKEEMEIILAEEAPKWFVVRRKTNLPELISDTLENQYLPEAENDSYILYKHVAKEEAP